MQAATGWRGEDPTFSTNEHKEVIDQYETVLKLAAGVPFSIVDFHGANKPTGLERTYPNRVLGRGGRVLRHGEGTHRASRRDDFALNRACWPDW